MLDAALRPWPARATRPTSVAVMYSTSRRFRIGVLLPDDAALREIEDALRIAERSGDDFALAARRSRRGFALVHRQRPRIGSAGYELLAEVRDVALTTSGSPCASYRSSTCTRHGEGHGMEISTGPYRSCARAAVDHLFADGQLMLLRMPATGVSGGDHCSIAGPRATWPKHEAAIDRLAAAPADAGWCSRDIWLLRTARAAGPRPRRRGGYRDYRDRYRTMATDLGFEGHMQWAEAMP